MMKRHTIQVFDLVQRLNRMEARAAVDADLTGVRVFVETVLMDTGNYNGYRELEHGRRHYIGVTP